MGESEGREKACTAEAQRARRGEKSKSMHHRDTEDTEKGNRALQENPLRTQRLCGEILSRAEKELAPPKEKDLNPGDLCASVVKYLYLIYLG